MDKDIIKAMLRDKVVIGYITSINTKGNPTIPPTSEITIEVDRLTEDFFNDSSKVAIIKLR